MQNQHVATVTLSVSWCNFLSSLDRSFVLNWADGTVGEAALVEVPALRVNDLVRDHLLGRPLAFLSIDVEGLDLAILQDFDFTTYRPWVVQVEPSDDHVPGNTKVMIEHMTAAGYLLIAKTSVNLLFVDGLTVPEQRTAFADQP